VPARR